MRSPLLALAGILLFVSAGRGQKAVELQQVVSRHDPALNVAEARLAVGRDGNIYLGSPGRNGGYVLRVSPDGKVLGGGKAGYSLTALAANKDGVIATAEAHFAHRTAFWDADFSALGNVADFLVSDQVQWNAPSDVCASESGHFYGIDQHRLRILKVTPPDKLAAAVSLEKLGVESKGSTVGLRVDEKNKRFLVAWRGGTIWAVGFDGQPLWKVQANPAGEPPGAFDVDAEGRLAVVSGGQESVRWFDLDGKPAGEVKLKNEPAQKPKSIYDLRVLGNTLIVKRKDPISLFDVYDRASGELLRRARADVEVLTVRYPSPVWTAGKIMPFEIKFEGGVHPTKPNFRAFLRPIGVPEYSKLSTFDGAVVPPDNARGLYQLRVTPDIRGRVTDYVVDGFVEIRAPNSAGTVSIFTPQNRFYYGKGEDIPLSIVVRAPKDTKPLSKVSLILQEGMTTSANRSAVHSVKFDVDLTGQKGTYTLSAKEIESLPPGRYTVDAEVPGYTVAPQYLELGPGLKARPTFHIVQHGDYNWGFPHGPRPVGLNVPPLMDLPDSTADHLARARRLGQNLFVDRLGHNTGSVTEIAKDDGLIERLRSDPVAVAPEKASFEGVVRRTVAGYGAYGMEEQGILLYMDAGLPVGTLFDGRKPEKMDADLKTAAEGMRPYPAFRGWSWAANWWLEKHGAAAAATPAEKSDYESALKQARATGAWSPVLDTVSDHTFAHAVAAEKRFRAIANEVAPNKLSVMTGPYRAVQTHPPIIFANADEVDLHYQAEQIQPPQVTPHQVDFCKRAGKRAWGHPELWNDDGTGGMIFPTLLQMAMRGADGVGESGPVGPWSDRDPTSSDPRNGAAGTTSAYRAIYSLMREYGPWLASFENADRVAIVVSTRMQRIETWDGKIGGAYFDTLFEAYNACLYAHRPASFVFVEDLRPDTFKRFKAILVAGQRVEIDPPLATALKQAQKDGIKVFHDGSCRPELVKEYTPLGVTFDRVKNDPSAWQDDSAYERFPRYFKRHAETLRTVLRPIVAPVASCDNPEIMLSERQSGDTRLVWAVNNTMLGWEPGLAWRTTLLMSQRVPVFERLKIDVPQGHIVYDLFARREAALENGTVPCDLRTMPARVFAILPPGKKLPETLVGKGGRRPSEELFGPHIRNVAVSRDGSVAMLNSFNWDHNLYGLDLTTGQTRWRSKIGHAFAFDPKASAYGFTAQGFDLTTGEGYHLYTLGTDGKAERRFALFGLPKRATSWASATMLQDSGINSFALADDGSWVASAGDLGLVVWDRNGKELWADEWWKTTRKRVRLVALDEQTLVVLDGTTAIARNARSGQQLWALKLMGSGTLGGGTVSGDRKTLVVHADTLGGTLFVIRNGKLVNSISAPADDVVVAHDGSLIVTSEHRQLRAVDPLGGLLWSYTGDDTLRHPRLSPDGQRIAVGSELGTLTLLDRNGTVISERDLLALPIPRWLPGGDLLVATWMGQVTRFDAALKPQWSVKPAPTETDARSKLLAVDATPTVRKTGWGNAAAAPLPLTPNLLADTRAMIGAFSDPKGHGDPQPWQNKIELLTDAKTDAVPEHPWLDWHAINYIDSGWRGRLTLQVDTYRTQLRLTGVTFVEDPNHPESWLRDTRLQWWDATAEVWCDGPYLLSDAAVHSHVLDKPIEAAKFRFVSTGGGSWPVGNIRLRKLVFHGDNLGPSHPDAVAKKPVAVLFDEKETDLQCLKHPNGLLQFRYTEALSGGKCLELKDAGSFGPQWLPPFGHAIPNWDFEIAEHPKPGQYRWLRFAWKATSEKTTGMSLLLGRAWPGGGVGVSVGDVKWNEGLMVEKRVEGKPPLAWREETVDLWTITKGKPPRIQALNLQTKGGGALVDRIILGRTEADLDAK